MSACYNDHEIPTILQATSTLATDNHHRKQDYQQEHAN